MLLDFVFNFVIWVVLRDVLSICLFIYLLVLVVIFSVEKAVSSYNCCFSFEVDGSVELVLKWVCGIMHVPIWVCFVFS